MVDVIKEIKNGSYKGIFYGIEGSKARKYYQHLLDWFLYKEKKKEIRLTDEMRTYLKYCWSGSVYEFCMKFNISGIELGDKLVQTWFNEEK